MKVSACRRKAVFCEGGLDASILPPEQKRSLKQYHGKLGRHSIFAFDLDGTITRQEILPCIAGELGLRDEMARLTELTLKGHIAFEDSFRFRFSLLRAVPVEAVQSIVAGISLDPHIEAFIQARPQRCVIITGNLDCWIAPLIRRLGCNCHCSRSTVSDLGRLELISVLDKGLAIRQLIAETGATVIAVGDSVNDIPMFEQSHMGIAFAGVHAPASDLVRLAGCTADTGRDLCRLLEKLT